MIASKSVTNSSQHRRTKSSVLSNLSFIHKRIPSAGDVLSGNLNDCFVATSSPESSQYPQSHHSTYKALEERHQNEQCQQPGRPENSDTGRKTLKKTISSLSLKSTSKKDTVKGAKALESKSKKTAKIRSSTNLTNLLSRPKSHANLRKEATPDQIPIDKNKENKPPIYNSEKKNQASLREPTYQYLTCEESISQVESDKFLEDEIHLYTPQVYSPGKQRNFYQTGKQPTLGKRDDTSLRPRSTYIPGPLSIQDISRRVSGGSRNSAELIRRGSEKFQIHERKSSLTVPKLEKPEKINQNRGQRVLAAVSSSFGAKVFKTSEDRSHKIIDDNDISMEFEAMLDRRNIPEHQRDKMRSLAMTLKKDFIKQDRAEIAASKKIKNEKNNTDTVANLTFSMNELPEPTPRRPRSRTFTISRTSSKDYGISFKKTKADSTHSKNTHRKPSESLKSRGKLFAGVGTSAAQSIIAKTKGKTPDDFVSYMKKTTKPESVEVGRLHKLRLLLRNETVSWTDEFIKQGGMGEIVELLHRIMAIEWREEHEDALLHEALLCLKALSTTALALKYLDDMQITLFPALLHMVFDAEKKGPSEFTTRNIITSLLFTYLKSAPIINRQERARTVLSYLQDPEPSESQKPVGFIFQMRRPRPYRTWCKEVVNVSKEVFWIFLHNLNVIPNSESQHSVDNVTCEGKIQSNSPVISQSCDSPNNIYSYMSKHFPQERPPIPAAPYVGGVEWDATNYLASHLDLLNGIIACLPDREQRNTLREQMLVSGWEKCMGGTLRLCNKKFYLSIHAGLCCWVTAAEEDGWETKDVRCGPYMESKEPICKHPPKKADLSVPKIALNFLGNSEVEKEVDSESVWL